MESELPLALRSMDAEPTESSPSVAQLCPTCAMLTARLVQAQQRWENASQLASWALNMRQSSMGTHGVPSPRGPADDTLDALTPREREVLRFVALGLSNRQIARTLLISEKTVKNHLYAIFAKLGVSDRTQAALFAVHASAPTNG